LVGGSIFHNCFSIQATVYNVSSTIKENCTNNPHGLWTNNTFGTSSCNANYFDIQVGTTLTVNETDGTAHLFGTAFNSPTSNTATIDILFGGFTDNHGDIGTVKNGGGGTPADWDFFTTVLGDISFSNGGSYTIDGFAGSTVFQLGLGACRTLAPINETI
jgi:hypothetical protein